LFRKYNFGGLYRVGGIVLMNLKEGYVVEACRRVLETSEQTKHLFEPDKG
jgi:hypothetical protein